MTSSYDYLDSMYGVEDAVMGVMAVVLIALFVVFLISIACYIMTSVGLQRVAKRRGISGSWMAWFPYTRDWLIGSIADEYDGRNGIKRAWRAVLLTLSLISTIGFWASYIAFIIWVVRLSMDEYYAMGLYGSSAFDLVGTMLGMYAALIVFALLSSAKNLCQLICIYKIFESTVPKRSVTYFLLYLLVPFAAPICILACSGKGYPFPQEEVPAQAGTMETVVEEQPGFAEEVVPQTEQLFYDDDDQLL